jgi:hypothetical protein
MLKAQAEQCGCESCMAMLAQLARPLSHSVDVETVEDQ